jgi:cytoskeletal protein RodZ
MRQSRLKQLLFIFFILAVVIIIWGALRLAGNNSGSSQQPADAQATADQSASDEQSLSDEEAAAKLEELKNPHMSAQPVDNQDSVVNDEPVEDTQTNQELDQLRAPSDVPELSNEEMNQQLEQLKK